MIFLGGGALVSCSTSTPINHIFFFCRIPVVLENHRSSQGRGGGGQKCKKRFKVAFSMPEFF